MRGYSRDTLLFILIAATMMVGLDYFLFGGKEARQAREELSAPPPVTVEAPVEPPAPVAVGPEQPPPPEAEADGAALWEPDPFDFFNEDMGAEADTETETGDPVPTEEPPPAIVPPAAPEAVVEPAPDPLARYEGRPRIAIVIDDVGMSLKYSDVAVNLPPPMTMAVLPYAEQANEYAHKARARGHDVLIHTPMEAMNAPVSLGGMGLTADMDSGAVAAMMDRITARFDAGVYTGINNHMGSRFTRDRAAMDRLMPYLKQHGLFFLDSKTIGDSSGAASARAAGVAYAVRDVFLDHEETIEFVRAALQKAERVARRDGAAIAIGHPKAVTMQGLQEWIPTLADKGIALVGVSALLRGVPVESEGGEEGGKAPTPTAFAPPDPAPASALPPPSAERLLLYSPSPQIRY